MIEKELEVYISNWRRRLEEEEEAKIRLREEAVGSARRIARVLVEDFGARRVCLLGSVLSPEEFTKWSDIDMVVFGLSPDLYFKALARAWRLLPRGMELDLIPYEDADAFLKERVLKEGMLLYDKEQLHSH
jgi:predicted nucleotidyltransferase